MLRNSGHVKDAWPAHHVKTTVTPIKRENVDFTEFQEDKAKSEKDTILAIPEYLHRKIPHSSCEWTMKNHQPTQVSNH